MTDYKFVRVVSEDDNTPNAPLVIDIMLNKDSEVKLGRPYCGWWGGLKSTDFYPFIAKIIDGTYMLDFGSFYDTDQNARYEICNLTHSKIFIGRKFKQKYGGDWYSLTVKSITDLITEQPADL